MIVLHTLADIFTYRLVLTRSCCHSCIVLCVLFLCTVSGNALGSYKSFVDGTRWKADTKEIEFPESHILPKGMLVGGENVLSSNLSLLVGIEGRPTQVVTSVEGIGAVFTDDAGIIRTKRRYHAEEFDIELDVKMEPDGFLLFDLRFIPNQGIKVNQFGLQIPFKREVAKYFSRYLEYDFLKQAIRVEAKNAPLEGRLNSAMQFQFSPSFWIGSHSGGLEWVTESNIDWILDEPDDAIQIEVSGESVLANFNFIKLGNGAAVDQPLSYKFGLFISNFSGSDVQANHYMVTGKHKIGGCSGDVINFYNWSKLPVKSPGLPAPGDSAEDRKRYNQIIEDVQKTGGKFVPYSSLYLMPTSESIFMENRKAWAVAGLQRNALWEKKTGNRFPIMPISLEPPELQDYLLETHKNFLKEFGSDGIYFDSAIPNRNLAKHKYGQLVNNSGQHIQYVPLLSHREFVRKFYLMAKAENPEFLIIHHAPSIPKFIGPYVDIVVFGEHLNRKFRTPGFKVNDRKSADRYVPDYSILPDTLVNDRGLRSLDHAQMMFLPQVSKFGNGEYLNENIQKFSRWSDSALEYGYQRKMLFWFTRLRSANVKEFVSENPGAC